MFIEFTVKNYRSIKEEQVLSMVKAKGNELEKSNSFLPDVSSSVSLLRSSVIYGPNAAGKSNVIRALMEMEYIVRHSASKNQEGDLISVTPFLFDETTSKEPTEFEMVFISEGIRYQYGFSATKTRVIEEWLIAYPKGRPQRWFSRAFNNETAAYEYKFSDYLLGQKSVWQNSTRSNALLLSTAVQLNSDQLKPVFNWFKEQLRPTNIDGWGPSFTASMCEESSTKKEILKFLKAADFDIHDIKIETEKFDPNSLPDEFPDDVKEKIIKEMKGKELIDIKTLHKTATGNLVPLDFEDESDGTKKFFSFAGPWIDILKNGYVLIVDELHDSLHPKMVKYLVELFHNEKTNPKNAQLIFTTHETSILNQEVFRRDQVWFCEKDSSQATTLYPLSDFSPRKDKENIELGYLSGRYGALPFIRPFNIKEA
ncbi:AAA family ATPase [Colwellia sp. 12G3]|uniref:AAA family ATPase n=1 Tax=Colwellia sp. 12G3 TaxID=2058299 RepID=UPI000C34C864|nr:ATP-binding protein [Colwellia sp. 12G3]PKI16291.1 ATP-binding protein [Colwellia sp. 12G3]